MDLSLNRVPSTFFKIAIWTVIIGLSVYFFIEGVFPYFSGDLPERKLAIQGWLVLHLIGGACSLFLGPFLLWKWFRNKYLWLHRRMGKGYILGTLVSAVLACRFMINDYQLPGAVPSLFVLAGLWAFMAVAAWVAIRRKDIRNHRCFVIRSYALGLAFVFIRILDRLEEFGYSVLSFIEDITMRYTLYEWMCWVFPLVIIELWLSWLPALKRSSASLK